MNLHFIINPISGGKSKKKLVELIEKSFQEPDYHIEILFTERENHATVLTKAALERGAEGVVAVGGDGTINEVAQVLIGTEVALGIIPYGSGNGLARHLNTYVSPQKAIEIIKKQHKKEIDVCKINEKSFLCTSGVGFDAYVSSLFAQSGKRGFQTYVESTLKAFFGYEPEQYILETEEGTREVEAFSVTFANASQYGNNAFIAPQAKIDDGFLDVCIVKPFPKWQMPKVGLDLFTKSLPNTSYYETFRTKSITLKRKKGGAVHLDGENYAFGDELRVSIEPRSLQVLVA
ncbi:MAG: diacylglycerol kinase family lipid kinase [Thermonemataceae bacterium]|nr:diacylglycerol kinase family lipid kinase [Thermonemataceae bacterium]